jgi:serine/threonine protein kinase/WD40 repeat protein
MNNTHHPSEAEILAEALRLLTPAEQAAYVRGAAGGDEEFRQRIEALLRAHDNAGEFLDNSRAAVTASTLPITTGMVPLTEKPGDRIGRYKLLEQIGEGGCGVVYVAEQEEPVHRRVALKVIKLGMDTRQVVARFEAERQALALMDHPNIAKVLDGGATETGRPFFVMELVKGVRITDYCDKNNLSTTERLGLFIQVCHAIQHAHQKGIIHRDIKPSNILVTLHDGVPVPKVIDFGIAKATTDQRLTDKTLYTAIEQFIGTPAYMSPEQAELSGLDIDTRSDIYALGVLLYELLTGKTPFDAKRLVEAGLNEIRRIISEEEPPRPSTRLSTLTAEEQTTTAKLRHTDPPKLVHLVRGDLDWIVMKCLEKDRTRRYETANGLADDLERHLGNEPIQARPASNLYRLRKFARRHRLPVVAAGAVTAALIVGLGLAAWGFVSEKKSRRRAEAAEATQTGLRQKAEAAERKATDKLWDAYLAQARANRRGHVAGRRFDSLAILAQAAEIRPSLELRNEAIACLTVPDLRLGNRWALSRHALSGFAFDSTLERYALLDERDDLVLRRTGGDAPATYLGGYATNVVWGLRFSPDDRWLAVLCSGQDQRAWRCQLWDLNRKEIALTLADVKRLEWVDFSSEGRWVAAGDTNGAITIRELASGQPTQTFSAGKDLLCVRFDPGGARLAVSHGEAIGIWDVKTGQALQSFRHARRVWAVAWHPTGTRLAAGCEDNRLYVWDIETGQTRTVMAGHQGIVNYVAFSHAGDLLASSSWDYTVKLWDPFTGSELVSHDGLGKEMRELKFSPDDRLLAYAFNLGPMVASFGVFEVAAGRECRMMPYELSSVQMSFIPWIGFSPEGRCLAVLDQDGLRFWDAATAQALAFLPYRPMTFGTGYQLQSVAFHPSDGLLVSSTVSLSELQMKFEEHESTLRIGPLRQDPNASDMGCPFAWINQQGDQFAVTCLNGHVHLLDEKTRRELVRLESPSRASVALSPDGQWVATGNVGGGSNSVRLFHLPATNVAHKLPISGRAIVRFSPDGKWLGVGRGLGVEIYRTGSWQLAHSISATNGLYSHGIFCFSPDGRILALAPSDFQVRLVDVETATELATLAAPNPQPLAWLAFSPDGSQLAAACLTQQIQLWDLRALRTQLAAMRLDWHSPPLPAVSPARTPPARVIVNTNTEVLQTHE